MACAVRAPLIFPTGFIVLTSALKRDSAKAIKMLRKSAHHNVMITGDNPLTACHVAKEVGITSKPFLLATLVDGTLSWRWKTVGEEDKGPVSINKAVSTIY